ncbi:MAG: hypothetical protein ABR584_12410 [Candidatus Baltobacteraceae bacterium]
MYGGPWALASRALLSAAIASFILIKVLERPSPLGYILFAVPALLCIVLAYAFARRLGAKK